MVGGSSKHVHHHQTTDSAAQLGCRQMFVITFTFIHIYAMLLCHTRAKVTLQTSLPPLQPIFRSTDHTGFRFAHSWCHPLDAFTQKPFAITNTIKQTHTYLSKHIFSVTHMRLIEFVSHQSPPFSNLQPEKERNHLAPGKFFQIIIPVGSKAKPVCNHDCCEMSR